MRFNKLIQKYALLCFLCSNVIATNLENNIAKAHKNQHQINNNLENKEKLQFAPLAIITTWLLKDVFFNKFKEDIKDAIIDNTYGVIYKDIFGDSQQARDNKEINAKLNQIIHKQVETIKIINANHKQIIDFFNSQTDNQFSSIQGKVSSNLDFINQYLPHYSSMKPTNDINRDSLNNISFNFDLSYYDITIRRNPNIKKNLLKKIYTLENNTIINDYWRALSFKENAKANLLSTSNFNLDTYFSNIYNGYANKLNDVIPKKDNNYFISNTNKTNPDNISEEILATNNLFLHKKAYDDLLYLNTLKAAYTLELIYKYELLAAYVYYKLDIKDIAMPSTFIKGAIAKSYEEAKQLLDKRIENAYKNLSKGLLNYQNKFNLENYVKGNWYITLFEIKGDDLKKNNNINNFLSLNPDKFFKFDKNNNLEKNLIYFDGMYLRIIKNNILYPIHTNVLACSSSELTSNGKALECSHKDDILNSEFIDLSYNNNSFNSGDIGSYFTKLFYGNVDTQSVILKNMKLLSSTIPDKNLKLLIEENGIKIQTPNSNGIKQYYLMSYKGNMFYIANASTRWNAYLNIACINYDNNCSIQSKDNKVVVLIFKDKSELEIYRRVTKHIKHRSYKNHIAVLH